MARHFIYKVAFKTEPGRPLEERDEQFVRLRNRPSAYKLFNLFKKLLEQNEEYIVELDNKKWVNITSDQLGEMMDLTGSRIRQHILWLLRKKFIEVKYTSIRRRPYAYRVIYPLEWIDQDMTDVE